MVNARDVHPQRSIRRRESMKMAHIAAIFLAACLIALPFGNIAHAGTVNCGAASDNYGTGIVRTRVCAVPDMPVAGADYSEAYYSLRATAVPGSAFANVGQRPNSDLGKILGRIAQKLLRGDGGGRSLTIGWQATIGGQTYPVQPLITIARATNGDWTVKTVDVSETLMHRMTSSATATLVYYYSDRATVDLTKVRTFVGQAVPLLATDAAKPVFDLAQTISQVAIDANTAQAQNSATQTLAPVRRQNVLVQLDITDPFAKKGEQPQVIASITFELRGTRSLLKEQADFDQLDTTMPGDGDGDGDRLNRLTRYALEGNPGKWPAVYSAIAGMGNNAPIGTAIGTTDAEVKKFCADTATAITQYFPLTTVDALLLKGAILNTATLSIQSKINPFPLCFPDSRSLAFLATKLNLKTDFVVTRPPPDNTPLTNDLLLKTAIAWFVSKNCSAADIANSPLADYVSDTVEITAREDLPADNKLEQLVIPEDLKVTRMAFLQASCGSFPWWNTRDAVKGQFHVDVRDSKVGWRVSGAMQGGKIVSIRISPVRSPTVAALPS